MAETKKRAAPKRARSSKAKPKSARARSAKPRSTNGSSGNDKAALDPVRHAIGDKAKTAGSAIGSAANRAKVPLIAGSAALAGAVGGAALASRHEHHRGLAKALWKPRIKLTSRDVAKAAKEVGNFSAQMGELATELQRARESTDNGRHRSPVEVVLQGLTSRR
ncbi:MAG TPA: hypothetical protein VLL27_13130 [Solirubrobacterales bacterium]|nr:hypothetical protein [Solirubrobacterales bacterium]